MKLQFVWHSSNYDSEHESALRKTMLKHKSIYYKYVSII